jgi:hypothetical protein
MCTLARTEFSAVGQRHGGQDKSTSMDAKENTFQEHFLNGLPAWEQASVQFA